MPTQENKSILGFMAGAFDPLHAGHILMFEQAKLYCNKLIVGLYAKPNPTVSIAERQFMLEAVRYVDDVIVYQSQTDLTNILQALPIDLRVISEAYRDKDFIGKQLITAGKMKALYCRKQNVWGNFSTAQAVRKARLNNTTQHKKSA